jgi:hypothetical protein
MAVEKLLKNDTPLGSRLPAVSTQDLEAILYGARLLSLAAARVYSLSHEPAQDTHTGGFEQYGQLEM